MWNWFKNRNEPELVRRYRKNTLRKSDRKTPASELGLIALDAETAAFDNPDVLPPGHVLLALQKHHHSE